MTNITHTTSGVPILRWSGLARLLHWGSGLLLLVTWCMIALHENTDDPNYLFISLHKAFGVTFLLWTLARLFNRLARPHHVPQTAMMPHWQQLLSKAVHFGLYAMMLAMPLAGFLMSQYANRAVNIFGLFDIPVFLTPNEATAGMLNNLHTEVFWTTLLLLTGAHILAALYHQLIKKDRLINRML